MALNKIVIMGRLTREPELRRTQNDTAVVTITVAVDRDFQPKDGSEKATDFIDVVFWRQKAEFLAKHFHKGSMICVEGSLQSRRWTDRDGNNRISWEVEGREMYFCGEKKKDGAPEAEYGEPEHTAPAFDERDFAEIEEDGDLPF